MYQNYMQIIDYVKVEAYAQTNIPTQGPPRPTQTRIYAPHEQPGRTFGAQTPPRQRSHSTQLLAVDELVADGLDVAPTNKLVQ